MRVLICGSREWVDWEPVVSLLMRAPPDTVVTYQGEPRGAGHIGGRVAEALGLAVEHSPIAGLPYGGVDHVVAFWLVGSTGTAELIEASRAAGLPVTITPRSPDEPYGTSESEQNEADSIQIAAELSRQPARGRSKRCPWSGRPVVVCVDGPRQGMWFFEDDWERECAGQRFLGRSVTDSTVLAYVRTTETQPHPEYSDVAGLVLRHRPRA